MQTVQLPTAQSLIHTRCGRTIAVSRFAPGVLPPGMGRVVLDTACEPYDRNEVWASLVSHCTVKNTLDHPPKVTVTLDDTGKDPIR